MKIPTDEIEEAKEYLVGVWMPEPIHACQTLQIVMIEAAKQIMVLSYRYKINLN